MGFQLLFIPQLGTMTILVMAPNVMRGEGWVFSYCSFLNLVPWQSWSRHQNYERGKGTLL